MNDTKIKICGLRRAEDIAFANALLPDFIGFVFVKASRRYVPPLCAARLRERLDTRITPVGVFADEEVGAIEEIVKTETVSMVQLHGRESEEYVKELKARVDAPIIKVFRPSEESAAHTVSDFLLLDNAQGGSGRVFDWKLIENARPVKPFFLAGGLNAGNAAEAVSRVRPYALDVSGGVETDGLKDFEKIRLFIEAAKGARL